MNIEHWWLNIFEIYLLLLLQKKLFCRYIFQIRCVLKLLDSFTKDPPNGVVFEYTSNIVADIKNQFTKSFKEDMVEYVEGRTRNYNFSNPNKSTRMLNKDVSIHLLISTRFMYYLYNQN